MWPIVVCTQREWTDVETDLFIGWLMNIVSLSRVRVWVYVYVFGFWMHVPVVCVSARKNKGKNPFLLLVCMCGVARGDLWSPYRAVPRKVIYYCVQCTTTEYRRDNASEPKATTPTCYMLVLCVYITSRFLCTKKYAGFYSILFSRASFCLVYLLIAYSHKYNIRTHKCL